MAGERRSVPRFELPRPVRAKVKAALPARVLDISSQGAQVEVSSHLRPEMSLDLRIHLEGGDVSLRATVRRCKAWGFGLDESGHRVLLYRAGVEFVDVPPEVMTKLSTSFLLASGGEAKTAEPDVLSSEVLVECPSGTHRAPVPLGSVKSRLGERDRPLPDRPGKPKG